MKKLLPLLKIIAALAALVLEFLPNGIRITSRYPIEGAKQWGEIVRYYSFVDPTVPFGSANYLPPITVLLNIIILVIIIVSIVKETRKADKLVFILSAVSVITSLPLLYGLYEYTLTGVIITILLILLSVLSFFDIDARRP